MTTTPTTSRPVTQQIRVDLGDYGFYYRYVTQYRGWEIRETLTGFHMSDETGESRFIDHRSPFDLKEALEYIDSQTTQ